MESNIFFITRYRLVQKKYNKLKYRYARSVSGGNISKGRAQEIKLKLEKYRKQLNELGLVLNRARKKGMLIGSLALGLTISACDDADNTDPFPGKIDLKELELIPITGTSNPLNHIIISRSTPTFPDIDDDGDLDLFIGAGIGRFSYYKNIGSSTSAALAHKPDENSLDGVVISQKSRISFGDIDGDGDLDCITGDGSRNGIQYYKNTGSSTTPIFTKQIGSANPFTGLEDFGKFTDYDLHPVLVDIDNDGDLDLFMATERYTYFSNTYEYSQQIRYYKNTGSKTTPVFTEQTDSNNPTDAITVGHDTKIHFADLDRDGDSDLIVYLSSPRALKVFENTGSQESPRFTELTGEDSPLSHISVPSDAVPTTADIDGDGDLDFFLGQFNGNILYFKNTTGE